MTSPCAKCQEVIQLDQSTDFEERRKIRAALRDLRNKRFKTVNVYETPMVNSTPSTFSSVLNSSNNQREVKKQGVVETHRPPEEAIFHAPVTERVHVIRKSQSFKTDRENLGVSNGSDNGVGSKSAARHFLSSHLAVMAVNGSDSASSSGVDAAKAFGVGRNQVGRSQSFKLLASKFENNAASSESSSSAALSSSHSGSFRSLAGNQLKSASTVVETEQVNQVVKVGRTHSLKLPSYRDSSNLDTAPIGSLAHSYNEKALKLMSGSDPNINRAGNIAVSKESLLLSRPIRPFTIHNGVTVVNGSDRDKSSRAESAAEYLQTSSGDNSSSSLPLHASVEKIRQDAGIHRSGSLHSQAPSPLLSPSEMSKVKRTGSLRNAPQRNSDRAAWRNSSPANIQEYFDSSERKSLDEGQNVASTEQSSLNLSRSSTEFGNESQLNTSGEEKLARKILEKSKGLNKYEDIQDEELLSQMLKEADDLDARINIRAALHKLRQNRVDDKSSQKSPTRHQSEEVAPQGQQQPPGFKTKLEQNKAALQSLMQLSGNQSVTNTSCDLETTSNSSSFLSSTQLSNNDEEVFTNNITSSLDNSTKSSDTPPTDYFSIENENDLQTLLNQTADYFERKKIRSALTTLKRRKSLAEIDRLKERSRSDKPKSVDKITRSSDVGKRHSFHGDHIIEEATRSGHLSANLDTGQIHHRKPDHSPHRVKPPTASTTVMQNGTKPITTESDKQKMGVNQNKHSQNNIKSVKTLPASFGNNESREIGRASSPSEKLETRLVRRKDKEPKAKQLVSSDNTSTSSSSGQKNKTTSLSRSNAVRGKRLKSYTATGTDSNTSESTEKKDHGVVMKKNNIEVTSGRSTPDSELNEGEINICESRSDGSEVKYMEKMIDGTNVVISAVSLVGKNVSPEAMPDDIEDGRSRVDSAASIGDGGFSNKNATVCDFSTQGDLSNTSGNHVTDKKAIHGKNISPVQTISSSDTLGEDGESFAVMNEESMTNIAKLESVSVSEDINRNYCTKNVRDGILNENTTMEGLVDIPTDNLSNTKASSSSIRDDASQVHPTIINDVHSEEPSGHSSVTANQNGSMISAKTSGLNGEANEKDKEDVCKDQVSGKLAVNSNAANDATEHEMKSLDELRDELEQLEKELEKSGDFDQRRRLRSDIRKIRVLIRDGDFILKTPRYVHPAASSNSLKAVSIELTETTTTSPSTNTQVSTDADKSSKDFSETSDKTKNRNSENCDIATRDSCQDDEVDTESLDRKKCREDVVKKLDSGDKYHRTMGNVEGQDHKEGYVLVEIVDGQVFTDEFDNELNEDVVTQVKDVGLVKGDVEILQTADISEVMNNNEHLNSNGGKSTHGKDVEVIEVDEGVVLSSQDTAVVIETVDRCERNKDGNDHDREDALPEVTTPLADLIAIDGECCSLTCHVTGPKNAKVIWYKENMVLKDTPEFKQTREGSLLCMVIQEVFPDDEGAYKCVVKANHGEAETSCYLLVKENKMAVLPCFVTPLQDVSAVGGDAVTLKCEVTGKPLPHIYWYYRDMMLKNHPDVKQGFIAGWVTLTIPQVIVDDSGSYSCVAKNPAGEVKCDCTLTVTETSTSAVLEEAPSVAMTTNDLDLGEGDCMTLVCQVTGSPSPSIVWKKDEDTLQSSENCRMDFVYGQASLVIYKVLPQDTGTYVCAAKNGAGEAGISVIVTVKAKPKPSKLPTPQNSQRQPLSSNRLSSSQSNLIGHKTDLSDKYLNAKNDKLSKSASRDRLNSGSRDRLNSNPKDNKKKSGSRERLHSGSTENLKSGSRERLNSSSKERRKFGSKERLHSTSTEKLESTGSRNRLILEKSQQQTTQESVKFTNEVPKRVLVENKAQPKSGVVEPPRIIKGLPEFYEVTLEQAMNLECKFNFLSQNTDVKWIKDGIELPRVGRIKWSVEKAYTKLWINRVSKGDVGFYQVVLSNMGGEVRDQTEVKFKAAPLRSKLQPKQVNEKASSLLHNVLDHMIHQQPVEGSQSSHEEHTRQLITHIQAHKEQNQGVPVTRASQGTKQFHSYLSSAEKAHTGTAGDLTKNTTERTTDQSKITMSSTNNIQDMEDEEELHKMMNNTDNFDERRKIRARLREIREAKSAEYEKRKSERNKNHEDAVQMKIRLAKEQKERKMKEFEDMAKQPKKAFSVAEEGIRKKHADADAARAKKLEEMKETARINAAAYNIDSDSLILQRKKQAEEDFKEDAVTRSTKTQDVPGGTMTTQVTTTTHKTKDGSTVTTKQSKQITQTGGIGGTTYNIQKTSAENAASRLSDTFSNKALEDTSGMITVKTESWSSKDGITRRNEKTKSWGGTSNLPAAKKTSAMDRFKQMDNTNNPEGSRPNAGGRVAIQRSPSAIKQLLLEWVKQKVKDYEHVNVTNFSTSWNDGMAFCALIHHFHPEAFDYSRLDPKKRKGNFTLAFKAAEKCADIAPLLDVEDMVRMKNPDWKCVFTYVQSFYQKFRNHDANQTTS